MAEDLIVAQALANICLTLFVNKYYIVVMSPSSHVDILEVIHKIIDTIYKKVSNQDYML